MKLVNTGIASIVLVMTLFVPAFANGQEVCPQGGEWSAHQDPPYVPVDGAIELCFKGGSENSDCESYLGPEIPEGEHVCDLSHWSYRLGEEPTDVPPTTVPEPTPTPTDAPQPTPTPSEQPPEPTPTSTDEGCRGDCEPTSTPTDPPPTEPPITPTPTDQPCPYEEIGELFLLTGPDGQKAWFGSYQRNPNTGLWAIPNTSSQERCLGWIAVNAEAGKIIYRDCNGNVNYTTIRCSGGADGICGAYIDG